MRKLAERLLTLEADSSTPSHADADEHEAMRVIGKLRLSLIRFAGSDGFTAMLRRALALARADVPALDTVRLKPDGSIEGFDAVVAYASNAGRDGALAITSHLLALLVTFIGEPLTLRLVRDAWPTERLEE